MKINREKGGTLILAIISLAVMSILGMTVLKMSLTETKKVVYQDEHMQAFYLARSGADAVSGHIIKNPDMAERFVSAPKSNTNSEFSNGTFDVEVTGNPDDRVLITGTGYTDGASASVSVALKRLGASGIIDKAIYSEDNLDIQNMKVVGDIESGGIIEYRTNGSNAYYGTGYPNSLRHIKLVDWPVCTPHIPSSIEVKNSSMTIEGSYSFSYIDVGQKGVLTFKTTGDTIKVVVDDINIDNSLDIDSSAGGRVELYINNTMTITTNGIINNLNPEDLIIYLADNSYLEIQAGKILNAYIIGPKATVEIQSEQSVINGAVICKKLQKNTTGSGANGRVNYVQITDTGILSSAVEFAVEGWTD